MSSPPFRSHDFFSAVLLSLRFLFNYESKVSLRSYLNLSSHSFRLGQGHRSFEAQNLSPTDTLILITGIRTLSLFTTLEPMTSLSVNILTRT